jgi:hypothetical protein
VFVLGRPFQPSSMFAGKVGTREPLLKGRLSTVDLLIKIGSFVKKENLVSV